jgi:hypothetical protein
MSPFLLLIANNIAVAECVSQVRGRGGKGRRLSPFPPAQRLIELHCAHREYVLFLAAWSLFVRAPGFSEKNFAPGSPQKDDSQLRGLIASAALTLVLVTAARIHREAAMRAGIPAFAGPFGFMVM